MDFIFDLPRLAALADGEQESYRSADPFPYLVIDDFLRPDAARAILDSFPGPDQDVGWDRYAAAGFEMKLASSREDLLPAPICRALHELNSGVFIRFLERLTGIPHLFADPHLLGGGVHLVGAGGHLGVHADFNWHEGLRAHRRVNLLLYFNPDWLPGFNGDLELWSADASHRVVSIAPVFNRAVIFNARSDAFHGHPAPLVLPDGVARRSIAMYYYSSERPEDETTAPHNTRYKGLHLE